MNIIRLLPVAVKSASNFVVTNRASISAGVAIGGVVVTAFVSGKAAIEADRALEQAKQKEELSTVEKAKVVAPILLPPLLIASTTIACMIFSHRADLKHQAALASALTISEIARTDYIDKVVETIGPEKAEEIRKKVIEDRIVSSSVDDIWVLDENGELYYDSWTGKKLLTTANALDAAAGKVASQMYGGASVSVEDFYIYLLEASNIYGGHETSGSMTAFGWNTGFDDPPMVSKWETRKINDKAYIVFDYHPHLLSSY